MTDRVNTPWIASPLISARGATAIFTQRTGGVSTPPFNSLNLGLGLGDSDRHVQQNLDRVCRQAGVSLPHQSQQVHGIDHHWYQGIGSYHAEQGDILLTQTRKTAIAVRTADCLPILICDPEAGMVAAVHAGWRGTAQNIASRAIDLMQQAGSLPRHIVASLGPCILPCCFKVDQTTAEQIRASHPQAHHAIRSNGSDFWPDLQNINQLQLELAGVPSGQIERHRQCTCCLSKTYFSHRRDKENSGRQLAIIQLP